MLQNESFPSSVENENTLEESGSELRSFQINDLIMEPALGLVPENSAFNPEQSKQLAEWAKSADIRTALEGIGYYDEELTDSSMKLLRLSLMTPRFLYMKDLQDKTGDRNVVMGLTEYHEVLRETIHANPDIKASELTTELQSASIWAGLPDSFRFSAGRMVEKAVNGARAELILEQLATSKAANLAGITYEQTSTEDDAKGVDLRLRVPIRKGSEETIVNMPVDVKFSIEQILALFSPDEEVKPYKIKNGIAVMWPGTSKEDLAGQLMLAPASAEEKGKKVVPILQMAAAEYHDYERRYKRTNKSMGHRAVRAA